jgi:hypothetical protein
MLRYYLLHILVAFIYGTYEYVETNTLCHSDGLFIWCRMRYNGVCVVNIPIVRYIAVKFLKEYVDVVPWKWRSTAQNM